MLKFYALKPPPEIHPTAFLGYFNFAFIGRIPYGQPQHFGCSSEAYVFSQGIFYVSNSFDFILFCRLIILEISVNFRTSLFMLNCSLFDDFTNQLYFQDLCRSSLRMARSTMLLSILFWNVYMTFKFDFLAHLRNRMAHVYMGLRIGL